MKLNPINEVDSILIKSGFSNFILSMIVGFKNNSDNFEGKNLPRFLESVSGWLEDVDVFMRVKEKVIPNDINLKIFSGMFYETRIYE